MLTPDLPQFRFLIISYTWLPCNPHSRSSTRFWQRNFRWRGDTLVTDSGARARTKGVL